MRGVYLDWAATSAIRPPEVAEAMADYVRECGGIPGRSAHAVAARASTVTEECRAALLDYLGLPGPSERLAFTVNGTTALNTALFGLLGPGDVLVTTVFDHASVSRPAAALATLRGVEVRTIPGSSDGSLDMEEAHRLLQGASVLTVNSVSNVLGHRLPIVELAALAHEAGARVIVDSAQAAGRIETGVAEAEADVVTFTGHKGLLGPQGIGGLWVREGIRVDPLVFGGTGGGCHLAEMPITMPHRLEAGTGNAPGVAGLLAALRYLRTSDADGRRRREAELKHTLREGLLRVDAVRVLSPADPEGVGIVTFDIPGRDPAEVADRLDGEWGVMCRAGIHCAPETHRLLGTLERGAVRCSIGWATSRDDIETALEAIERIARG